MNNVAEPPFLLDSARVIMYAETGGKASYTGKITVHADGRWLDPVPRLAICEDLVDGTTLIFHCDEHWNVLAAGGAKTVEDAKQTAELAYSGISSKWMTYRPLTSSEMAQLEGERKELQAIAARFPIEGGPHAV
jgi:hypothetical protein